MAVNNYKLTKTSQRRFSIVFPSNYEAITLCHMSYAQLQY